MSKVPRYMLSLVAMFLSDAAFAAVPLQLPYQAYVTDPDGTPIDGTIAIDLRLWNDPVSDGQGEFLYGEEHASVAVSQGLFQIIIGTGDFSQDQDPLEQEMFADDVWLEIDIDGETLAPRRRLRTTAFAVRSAVAEDVTGSVISGSNIIDNTVTGSDVFPGSLDGTGIADESLRAIDRLDEAGATWSIGDQLVNLGTNTIVRTLIIDAPTTGAVIVSAHGTFVMGSNTQAACAVTDGTQIVNGIAVEAITTNFTMNVPFATTRGFNVPVGNNTFRLVCSDSGGAGAAVGDTGMTAIYVPTVY